MKKLFIIILAAILTYTAVMPAYASEESIGRCRITFYCSCARCCGRAGQKTASGTWPQRYRTIAAGPSLPFGTRIRIDGFEDIRVVEDRGVSDSCIDVYVPDHEECLRLGMFYRECFIVKGDSDENDR